MLLKLGTFTFIFVFFLLVFGLVQVDGVVAQEEIIDNLSEEGFSAVYSEEGLQEFRYQTIMDQWKKKQGHLWDALKTDPFTINASAYTAASDECGKSDGITASGIKVEEKRTLACPPSYPFGTKIEIETMGTYICEDRGGAIKGNHFDIYMEKKSDAFAFGRKNLTAKVVLE